MVQEELELPLEDDRKIIIGKTQPMQDVLRQIKQFGPVKGTVLITGERGVGKEGVAEALFKGSKRNEKLFKAVDCGSLSETLLESEIFGHEKGSFTGADTQRKGVFEQADGGTLFLDEIGNMSLEAQVKFLRVLETQEFTRLGGVKDIKVDVRVIAATNIDLAAAMEEKKFKPDLYDRLNLFHIRIPPLRDRREDIPTFVEMFIKEFSAEHGKRITGITKDALDCLQKYDWPSNVRGLKNAVESAVVLSPENREELQLEDFPTEKLQPVDEEPQPEDATDTTDTTEEPQPEDTTDTTDTTEEPQSEDATSTSKELQPEDATPTTEEPQSEDATSTSKEPQPEDATSDPDPITIQRIVDSCVAESIQRMFRSGGTQPSFLSEQPQMDWQDHLERELENQRSDFESLDLDFEEVKKVMCERMEEEVKRLLATITPNEDTAKQFEKVLNVYAKAKNIGGGGRGVLEKHTDDSDRMFNTLVALLDEDIILQRIRKNAPYYKTGEGKIKPFFSRGNLNPTYEHVLKPVLDHFKKDENLGFRDKLIKEGCAEIGKRLTKNTLTQLNILLKCLSVDGTT